MTWNFDIASAPRGKEAITKITVDGKERTKREHHVDPVWLALESGEVIRSYWIPEGKTTGQARWSGMNPGVEPIAWQTFVVPEHPHHSNTDAAISSHRLAILDGPSAANRSEEEAPEADASGGVQDGMLPVHPATQIPIIEDAGSGA